MTIETRPLVSVIIPSWNRADIIERTVASALEQTYRPLEIVVIDDGSTDRTGEVLDRLGDRITAVRKPNGGVASARNEGVKKARGEYLAFLDSDDSWDPGKLEKQLALFRENPALGLVYSDCRFEKDGKILDKTYFSHHPPARGDIVGPFLQDNFIPLLTAVVPKRVFDELGPFSRDLYISEDYEFFLKVACKYPADYVEEPLGCYLLHEGNYSRDTLRRIRETLVVLDRFPGFEGADAARHRATVRRFAAQLRHDAGYVLFNQGKTSEARGEFFSALGGRPAAWKTWVYLAVSFLGPGAAKRLGLTGRATFLED